MSSENKKGVQERFKFIDDEKSIEEVEEDLSEDKVEEEKNIKDNEVELLGLPENKSEETTDESNTNSIVVEEVEPVEQIPEKKEEVPKKNIEEEKLDSKSHFSFTGRVVIMAFLILLFFGIAIFLSYEAINHNSSAVVHYDEVSDTSYKVCLNNTTECISEGLKYEENKVKSVLVNFDYDAKFSEDIDYKLAYHIETITKIYNRYDNSKVLYKNKKTLVDKTDISKDSNTININKDVTIDYNDYNQEVKNYKGDYVEYSQASVEVILYLDENVGTRKISSVTVPLNVEGFTIKKYDTSNKNRAVHLERKTWNTYNTICAAIASILVIIALVLVYKATSLVMKVVSSKNAYQRKVMQILNEYDRIIVVARDGYESNVEKEIIKVNNFDELLDVKDHLRKPIIYSKVNDVKCEFIVEDDDKLYKYILKESD